MSSTASTGVSSNSGNRGYLSYFFTTVSAIALYAGLKVLKFYRSSQKHYALLALARKKLNERNQKRRRFQQRLKEYWASRRESIAGGGASGAATGGSAEEAKSAHSNADQELAQLKQRIYRSTAKQLRDMIVSGEVSCQDVVATYAERSIDAGERYNLVAEELYDTALTTAAARDAMLANARRRGEPLPEPRPLEGVPISVKDQIDIEGYDSTCGMAVRCFNPASKTCVLIQLLVENGAIPIVRGNVPQSLMLPESENNIWGCAKNPWNIARTTGGSSGGDAGLVAFRAVPLAIGTDIGGSLRIPAHYCGVFSFKPTPQRISNVGIAAPRINNVNGQQIIRGVAGPLANCVEDLVTVMRCWLVPKLAEADPTTPPCLFDEKMFQGYARHPNAPVDPSSRQPKLRLRIGYYHLSDGYAHVAPSLSRAVLEAKEMLEAQGHELVPFNPPGVADVVAYYIGILGGDGKMAAFREGLEGERLHSCYSQLYKTSRIPNCLRPLLAFFVGRLAGEHRVAQLIRASRGKSTGEHWKDVAALKMFCARFAKAWEDLSLDAVLCPASALPAVPHGASKDMMPLFCHTFLWNALHYPSGTMPITKVQAGEDTYLTGAALEAALKLESEAVSTGNYSVVGCSKDRFSKAAHRAAIGSVGLPVSVQIAAAPYRDELVLRLMSDLEDAIRRRNPDAFSAFVPESAK